MPAVVSSLSPRRNGNARSLRTAVVDVRADDIWPTAIKCGASRSARELMLSDMVPYMMARKRSATGDRKIGLVTLVGPSRIQVMARPRRELLVRKVVWRSQGLRIMSGSV